MALDGVAAESGDESMHNSDEERGTFCVNCNTVHSDAEERVPRQDEDDYVDISGWWLH